MKPTSVYTVNKIPNSLVVIAHLSEAIPRFWLIDQVSLETFVSNELEYGLRLAVEAKLLADVNGTSGIQTQAYATSVLTVLRKSITKLETAGYTPGSPTAHGYGSSHQRLRARLKPVVEAGQAVCWRCGKWIPPSSEWDLGHDDYDRSRYWGAKHRSCNRSKRPAVAPRRAAALKFFDTR